MQRKACTHGSELRAKPVKSGACQSSAMRFLFILFIFLFPVLQVSAQACNVLLSTQDEIDAVPYNFPGSNAFDTAIISECEAGNIVDLSGWLQITAVHKGVYPARLHQLTSHSGLSALTHAALSQTIENDQLINMDALKALHALDLGLTITDCPKVQNLHGLSALENIGPGIRILRNESLASLEGLGQGPCFRYLNIATSPSEIWTAKDFHGRILVRLYAQNGQCTLDMETSAAGVYLIQNSHREYTRVVKE